MIKKILVPVDGSANADAAIEKAREIAEAFSSEVILLHAADSSSMTYPSYPYKFSPELINTYRKENKDISNKILQAAKQKISVLGQKVKTESIEGVPYEVILKYVDENSIDLVIMGSNGMGGVRNMMGSVTRKVVLSVRKPILIIPQPIEE
jgi:nucleotide-binding universal stress UspA family protein